MATERQTCSARYTENFRSCLAWWFGIKMFGLGFKFPRQSDQSSETIGSLFGFSLWSMVISVENHASHSWSQTALVDFSSDQCGCLYSKVPWIQRPLGSYQRSLTTEEVASVQMLHTACALPWYRIWLHKAVGKSEDLGKITGKRWAQKSPTSPGSWKESHPGTKWVQVSASGTLSPERLNKPQGTRRPRSFQSQFGAWGRLCRLNRGKTKLRTRR